MPEFGASLIAITDYKAEARPNKTFIVQASLTIVNEGISASRFCYQVARGSQICFANFI
jgi:hypothetical protein